MVVAQSNCRRITMESWLSGANPEISFGGGHEAPKAPRSSAAGARIEAPQAPRVWGVERGCPLPTGGGVWGRGCAPSPEIFFQYCIIKWPVLVDSDVLHVLLIVVTNT